MQWFSQAPDRRRWPRFQADFSAMANVVGDSDIVSLPVRCHSISEGGVGIYGLEGLESGDLVTLELHIPVAKQAIWVDSTVRHSSGSFGLEFVSLSNGQLKLVKRYCRLQPQEKRQRCPHSS